MLGKRWDFKERKSLFVVDLLHRIIVLKRILLFHILILCSL